MSKRVVRISRHKKVIVKGEGDKAQVNLAFGTYTLAEITALQGAMVGEAKKAPAKKVTKKKAPAKG